MRPVKGTAGDPRCGVSPVQYGRNLGLQDKSMQGDCRELVRRYMEPIRGGLLDPESQRSADILTRVKGEMAEPRRTKSTF
jgi:hypothetical protein